jgi:hypothetical protein
MQPLNDLILNLWRNTKSTEKLLYAFKLSPILKAKYILKREFINIKKCTSLILLKLTFLMDN